MGIPGSSAEYEWWSAQRPLSMRSTDFGLLALRRRAMEFGRLWCRTN
jgi:hypothetical protein